MELIFFIAAYLLGSVNFSILLFRVLGKGDPRDAFSGNAGVTNVYRQAGLFWAGAVFCLELGRGVAVAWAALRCLSPEIIPWAGFALIVGNGFPCFHQFRGGKGVASFLSFTIPIAPAAAGFSALLWVVLYGIVRIPFIASFFMIAVLASGTVIAFGCRVVPALGALAAALFVIYRHKKNISEWLKAKK